MAASPCNENFVEDYESLDEDYESSGEDSEILPQDHESMAKDYEDLARRHGITVDIFPLDRSQTLHLLRREQEWAHRFRMYHYSALGSWILYPFHQPINFDTLSGLRLEDADGSCNRTAPIFVLRENSYPKGPLRDLPAFNLGGATFNSVDIPLPQAEALLSHLQDYIYRRWFRPYKSEIDRDQFLTKINVPQPCPLPPGTCSLSMADLVKKMSANFIARVRHTKSQESSSKEKESGQVLYYIQPLFEAIALSIRAANFNYEAPDVANLPVLIVRTGIEKSLSAPITFETIPAAARINECTDSDGSLVAVETRLETAITFLMELEQREAKASPPLPDPELVTQDMSNEFLDGDVYCTFTDLGWKKATMGPLRGPSSRWGDPDRHPNLPDGQQSVDGYYTRLADITCRHSRINMDSYKATSQLLVARSQGVKGPLSITVGHATVS